MFGFSEALYFLLSVNISFALVYPVTYILSNFPISGRYKCEYGGMIGLSLEAVPSRSKIAILYEQRVRASEQGSDDSMNLHGQIDNSIS